MAGLRRLLGTGAATLRRNGYALVLALRHPRIGFPVKLLIGLLLLYALSPIDLMPDVVPVLGWIDDLVIVPFGLWLVTRVIPPGIWQECQARAGERRHTVVLVAGLIAAWLVLVGAAALVLAA